MQEIKLTQENQTALQTLLPSLRSSTGKFSSSFLAKSPETALEAIRSNKNQISGLVREAGAIHVDAAILVLLNEVFALTNSPINNLATMAVMVRKNFYMLRFEEIIFAMNKGINGGYGKLFGHLSYPQISEWLNLYIDTDRAATVDHRAMEKQGEMKAEMKAPYEPDSLMAQLVNAFHTQKDEVKFKRTPERLRLTLENYDRGYLKNLMSRQNEITTDELYKIQALATENGYKFSAEHVAEEIERRESGGN